MQQDSQRLQLNTELTGALGSQSPEILEGAPSETNRSDTAPGETEIPRNPDIRTGVLARTVARLKSRGSKERALLFITLFLGLTGIWLVWNMTTKSTIVIPMVQPVKAVQIYFFDPRSGYSELNSRVVAIDTAIGGQSIFAAFRFRAGERFRFDLLGDGSMRLDGTVRREQQGWFHKSITKYALDLSRLPVHDLKLIGDRLDFSAAGDPYIDIILSRLPVMERTTYISLIVPAFVLALGLTAFLTYRWYCVLLENALLITLSAIFLCFAGSAAIALPVNHGPDEIHHVLSGNWYTGHLLPPSMADRDVFYDGHYGVDYIVGQPDLTYLLTFKVASSLAGASAVDEFTAGRLAQLVIAFILLVVTLRYAGSRRAAFLLLGFAIVPQATYLLTYVNGDALSFGISLAALLVLGSQRTLGKWVVMVCFFLLMNCKLQYLELLPVAAVLLYRRSRFLDLRWAAIGCLLGCYKYVFMAVDEIALRRTFRQNQIAHASAAVQAKLMHPGVDVSVFVRPEFYIGSLKSAYAVFGFFNFEFARPVYLIGALLAVVLMWRNGWRRNAALGAFFICNVAASIYYSATYDYQPQGRYLFPTLVFAMVLAAERLTPRILLPFVIPTVFCLMSFVTLLIDQTSLNQAVYSTWKTWSFP